MRYDIKIDFISTISILENVPIISFSIQKSKLLQVKTIKKNKCLHLFLSCFQFVLIYFKTLNSTLAKDKYHNFTMALFQQTILKKHIESLNSVVINEKWNLFQSHFQNTVIQQNIRKLKEEQYQGEFLEDLFVKIFGYTKAPSENFNLITELKPNHIEFDKEEIVSKSI